MSYTYNSQPELYKLDCPNTNCGSFAFRIKEWYHPEDGLIDEVGEIDCWIADMIEMGYSIDEITEIYLDAIVEQIMEDFYGTIEICDGQPPGTDDKELVALSVFCDWDKDFWSDYDFHFKVLRNGRWQDKPGMEPIRFCTKDDWGRYTSKVVYFYHKVNDDYKEM